jgi:hypothetical protein
MASQFGFWWHRHSCLCKYRQHRRECLCHLPRKNENGGACAPPFDDPFDDHRPPPFGVTFNFILSFFRSTVISISTFGFCAASAAM